MALRRDEKSGKVVPDFQVRGILVHKKTLDCDVNILEVMSEYHEKENSDGAVVCLAYSNRKTKCQNYRKKSRN